MSDRTELKFDLQLFAEGDGDGDGDGGGVSGDGGNANYFPGYMEQLNGENRRDEWGRQFKNFNDVYMLAKGSSARLKTYDPPGKASEYEFPAPAENSGITVDPETEKWFRKTAHSLKLPKEMAGKLYGEFNKMAAGRVKTVSDQSAADKTKADELVHGEWGSEYDKNMALADKGIVDTGGEDLMKILTDAGLKTNLVILNAFKQIGYEHGDDTLKEGGVSLKTDPEEGPDLKKVYPTMAHLPGRQ